MQLSVADVAKICDVSENEVFRWIDEDGLKADRVAGRYYVNPAELLEWATTRKMHVSPTIFQTLNGDSVGPTGLAEALANGTVVHDVPGGDLPSVLRAVVQALPLPESFDRDGLVQLLLRREAIGTTAVGDGIAIPHPGKPVLLPGARRVAELCFLQQPLDLKAADGQPVDTLFVLITPTVRDHLQLLARLASVLHESSFRALLRQRPSRDELLKAVQAAEQALETTTAT